MQYKQRYTFSRIDQDLAPDKRDASTHLNIVNMEVFLTSRGASLQAAKGPEEIPDPNSVLYNNIVVIGHGTIEDDLYIFTTDNQGEPNLSSNDAIIKVIVTDTQLQLELVKASSWGFSSANPISAIGVKESSTSEKLYWVDSYNQARFTNVIDKGDLNVDYVLSNPTPALITAMPYGVTASKDAVVRYAYTQYNIGGSESKLSPLTNAVSISTDGDSAKVVISGLSPNVYDTYRIYRVMWTSYNDAPTYSMVSEGEVGDTSSITIIDGGNLLVTDLSVEEFIDIGSDLMVPGTLESKKQRLFFADYTITPYEVTEDVRAFSYDDTAGTSLDTPAAIPADLNLLYAPTAGGAPVNGLIYNVLAGNTESANVCLTVNCAGNTHEFTVPDTSFYIGITENCEVDITITVYKGTDTGKTDPIYSSVFVSGESASNKSVHIASFIPSGYIVVVEPVGNYLQPVFVEVVWSATLDQQIIFHIQHDQVPDTGEWVYSGVTGVAATSRAKFKLASNPNYSAYYTATSAVNNGTSTELTFLFTGGLYVNGTRAGTGTRWYPYMEADLEGTRQQILSDLGTIKLREASQAVGDGTAYSSYNNIPLDIDAINSDYDVYQYQSDKLTLGAEGPITKLTLSLVPGSSLYVKDRKFKSGEIYRIGVVFYDEYGRSTSAMWVADLRIPYVSNGNTTTGERDFYKLEGEVKAMPTDVNGKAAEAFKFVYVKRSLADKSILFQGVVQPVMQYTKGGDTVGLYPFPTTKEIKGNGASASGYSHFDVRVPYNPTVEEDYPLNGTVPFQTAIHDQKINFVYTPETFLYNTKLPANKVRLIGVQEILPALDKTRMEFYDPDFASGEGYDNQVILNSMGFSMRAEMNGQDHTPQCLLDDFTNHDDGKDSYAIWMYFRGGGRFHACTHKDETIGECEYLGVDAVATVDSYVISNTIDQLAFTGEQNNDPCNYQAEHADSFVIKTDSVTWAGTPNYADFLTGSTLGTAVTDRAFPIVEVLQTLNEQYGGSSLEAKSRNTYIDASQGANTINTKVQLYGDVYNSVYFLPKSTSARKITDGHTASVFDYIKVSLESEVNMEAANKILTDINGSLDGAIAGNLKLLEVKNLLTYNTLYSQLPTVPVSLAKPFNYIKITEYPARITTTNAKVAGESVDNWTKVSLGTYMDLESAYGSITKLVRSRDNMFAFQNRGIAFVSILPEKQVQTGSGSLQLAKGEVLDNYEYVSIDSGTENKNCIATQDEHIFYIDTVKKTLNSLTKGGEISTLKGFNSVIRKYASDDIKANLDPTNKGGGFVIINNNLKQVLFKFANATDFPVLIYNYEAGYFTNSRTYDSYYYMSFNNFVISTKSGKLYRHDYGDIGNYYGNTEEAYIELYTEPFPAVDKVFDAISVLKEGPGNFDYITVDSPERTSGRVPTNFKDKFDLFTSHLPRVENSHDRFRERNLKIKLEYTGSDKLEVDEIFLKFSVKK